MGEGEGVLLGVPLGDGVMEGVPLGDGVMGGVAVALSVAAALPVGAQLAVGLPEVDAEGEGAAEGGALRDAAALRLAVPVVRAVGVAHDVPLAVAEAGALCDAVALRDLSGEGDAEGEGEGERDAQDVGDSEAVGALLREAEGNAVEDTVARAVRRAVGVVFLPVAVASEVREGSGDADVDGVAEGDGESRGDGVAEAAGSVEAVGVREAPTVFVRLPLPLAQPLGDGVAVCGAEVEGLPETDAVRVAKGVSDPDPLAPAVAAAAAEAEAPNSDAVGPLDDEGEASADGLSAGVLETAAEGAVERALADGVGASEALNCAVWEAEPPLGEACGLGVEVR